MTFVRSLEVLAIDELVGRFRRDGAVAIQSADLFGGGEDWRWDETAECENGRSANLGVSLDRMWAAMRDW